MPQPLREQLSNAASALKADGVIAYPTESCFGLGCNPKSYKAVKRILKMKRRPYAKGLILIAHDYSQLSVYLQKLPEELLNKMTSSWPSATTWLCPAAPWVPTWLKGKHQQIAVRIPAHRIARQLCKQTGYALVSTSANLSGQRALRHYQQVDKIFTDKIDYLVQAKCGGAKRASTIIDLITDQVIR